MLENPSGRHAQERVHSKLCPGAGVSEVTLRCVECGAVPLSAAPDGVLQCSQCKTTYFRHAFRGIPVFISRRSRLDARQILQTEVKPRTADIGIARSHWQTSNLASLLRPVSGRKLLNFGCGFGGDRLWLEEQGYDVTAFDVFPGPYTDFVADGHELPFADQQFDIVTSVSVLQYLHDPFKAMREAARVLKPSGVLIGTCAFLEPQDSETYFHVTHLGLKEILHAAGFTGVEVHPGWSFRESLSSHFWLWNRSAAIRHLTRPLNQLSFTFGKALWDIGYRLRGKRAPDDWPLRFAGSLVFKALKDDQKANRTS